jgi:hypothetical protein
MGYIRELEQVLALAYYSQLQADEGSAPVLLSAAEIDVQILGKHEALRQLQAQQEQALNAFNEETLLNEQLAAMMRSRRRGVIDI